MGILDSTSIFPNEKVYDQRDYVYAPGERQAISSTTEEIKKLEADYKLSSNGVKHVEDFKSAMESIDSNLARYFGPQHPIRIAIKNQIENKG